MKNILTRSLSILLVLVLVLSLAAPAMAATYRPGAQSGPSSSYAGGKYYQNYLRVPITGDNRTDLIAVALSQLGYQESDSNGSFSGEVTGSSNYVEYSYNMGDLGLGYGGSDYPWCACFVSWCLYQSQCTDQSTYSSMCRFHSGDYNYIWKEISCSQWVTQLKGAGYYRYSAYEGGSYTPQSGDLVFFQTSGTIGHIGICLYTSNGYIYTVEGNTSDASGLETNGGGVYFKSYSLSSSYIDGYGVLPYQTNSSVPKIDYSGANATPGLYVANATKYIYNGETGSDYTYLLPRFTMFEVTEVCSSGRLKMIGVSNTGETVTGYVDNSSARVIQLSSTSASTTPGGDTGNFPDEYDPSMAGDGVIYAHGLDLSYWQGSETDFQNIKNAGYSYVILRCGSTKGIDSCFETFYANAKAAGLDVGAYYYSYATTTEGAYADASNALTWLAGKTFEYPIYFDYEDSSQGSISGTDAANICYAFLNTVRDAGYLAGLYSMASWIESDWVTTSGLRDAYEGWVAHYPSTDSNTGITSGVFQTYSPKYSTKYGMYQYSSTTYVNGKGAYDANVCFKDYPAIVKYYGFNGYTATGGSKAAARTALQNAIAAAEGIAFYHYPEAQLPVIRGAYQTACQVLNDAASTADAMNAAAEALTAELNKTGSNTIAMNNQGVYINGKNGYIASGDCFIYTSDWNGGLITTENANIRYTLNLVLAWDEARQINVVKSVSTGIGSDTPSIQLSEGEWMIACHDWETGVTVDPVAYSGTNHRILSSLSVGDAVVLSGCSGLDDSGVEIGSYLKVIPGDATIVHGEDAQVGNGQTILFTPNFNNGMLDYYYANVEWTLNVIAQWDHVKRAWMVVDKFHGNGAQDNSARIELDEDQILIACHAGTDDAASYNYANCDRAQIGQQVIFSGISPTDGTTARSVASYVSFVDYDGSIFEESSNENLALNKDYFVTNPGDTSYTANLTDGSWTDEMTYDNQWFGFVRDGHNQNTDANGVGTVVIDLGAIYDLTAFRAHVYAGENDGGVGTPGFVNVLVSNNNVDFVAVGSMVMNASSEASYWAALAQSGYAARYVKFEIGPDSSLNWVFLNELQVYGSPLNGNENIAIGNDAALTDGVLDQWYSIDTSTGSGSAVIDLGGQYNLSQVQAFLAAGSAVTAPGKISVLLSNDGVSYVTAGQLQLNTSADQGYWAQLGMNAAVGRYVKLVADSEAGAVLLSEVEVSGVAYSPADDNNIAQGKNMMLSGYTNSPFTALLNDGIAVKGFQYNFNNSSWFAFKNTGDATGNVNLNNDRGVITIDLGGMADVTKVKVHLFAGNNEAGAVAPDHIAVYYSADGIAFSYMGDCAVDANATESYWSVLNISNAPVNTRYVKLGVGVNDGTMVLMNEVEVHGAMSLDVDTEEIGSLSNVSLVGTFNSWNTTPNMTYVGENLVSGILTLTQDTYEFKLLYNNEWLGNNGTIYDTTGNNGWVMDTASNNCVLVAGQDGDYEFLFNLETRELKVAYLPDTLYLRGSFNEWGTADAMTYNGDGNYYITVSLAAGSYEYKIADAGYAAQWPAMNATLELPASADVTFILNHYSGEITVVPAYTGHHYIPSVTAPTCTEAGYTTYTCSICGDSYVDDEVPALGHGAISYSFANNIHSFTCTVCGEVMTKEATDGKQFKINSAAPVLGEDIALNYRVTLPAGFENAYMVFEMNGVTTTVTNCTLNSNGQYSFIFPGINPLTIGDNVCATLYATFEGTPVSVQIAQYSVLKYCDNQLKKTTITDTLRTILSDVLVYGAKAQIYKDYLDYGLVTDRVTDPASLTPSTFTALDASYNLQKVYGDSNNTDINFRNVSLVLGSKVKIRLGVTCTDLNADYTFKVTVAGEEYTYTTADLVAEDAANGKYYLDFDKLRAVQLGELVTATIWDGETQVGRTVEYSVYTYVQKNQTSSNTAMVELLEAIYNYGESAKKA